jgi:hypothetical protein
VVHQPRRSQWSHNYQYDSCRPFRIARLVTSELRASLTRQEQQSAPRRLNIGRYSLAGAPQPANKTGQSAAFIGPAGVGAMGAPAYQGFLDDAYRDVATLNLLVGGTYYELSWTVMSLLMMTGNFLDYTAYPSSL